MNSRNRVVVTGMGIVAPNGIGLDAFWQSLLDAKSGIGPITLFDASNFKSRIAGEVADFDPSDYIEADLKPKRMARHTQFAYAAAMMALNDAGLEFQDLPSDGPIPVVIGVSTSALDVIERVFQDVTGPGPDRVSPTALGASTPQAVANVIADRIGACALASTVSSACSSGLDAIAIAAAMIRSGEAEIAIAGGADAPITPLTMASFIASGRCAMQHAAQDQFVTEIGEMRQRRFHHDRLVDFERRLTCAELILLRRGDRDHAIASEAVGRNELGAHMSLRVGSERCIPKRAGEKVLSQAIEQRRPAFAITDQVSFVREVRLIGILLQKCRQRQVRLHLERTPLIEKGERIRRLVVGERKHSLIDGVEHHLGIGRRLPLRIAHFRFESRLCRRVSRQRSTVLPEP